MTIKALTPPPPLPPLPPSLVVFKKERMSHLCDSTVAGPTARRDNVLASKCEYPPFRYPPFKCAR